MKIICTQENLKNSLMVVGRLVSTNTSLPILNNLLLKTESGLLEVSSTNLEIAISTQIRCKIEEDGGVTVSARVLSDLVGNMPNKNTTLTTNNNEIKIESENYHTSIKTLPQEDFPLIPSLEGQTKITAQAQDLKQSLDQVAFATSNNQTQIEITGVFFGFEKQSLKLAATDRYRLAEKTLKLGDGDIKTQEVIVPHKTVVELCRIIGQKNGQVDIFVGETQIGFVFGETKIISRLIDGQYPDYKQIIPTDFKTNILIDRAALSSALKTVSIFSQSSNSVKLEYAPDKQKLKLSTESQELGSSVVDLEAKIEGGNGGLVLNYRYILDCLSSVNSQNVSMKIVNDNSPSLMVPEGDGSFLYLIMPIKS